MLLHIVRQGDPKNWGAVIERLQAEGITREVARRATKEEKGKPQRGRPRHFVYRYQPKEKTYALALQFKKDQVPREEIVHALRAIIADLMNDEG